MLRRVGAILLLGSLLVAGIGCSKEESSDRLCDSYEAFSTSVRDLQQVDIVNGGLDSARTAVDKVSASFGDLKDAAKDQFGSELGDFKASLDGLASVIAGLPSQPSPTDAKVAVETAVARVKDSYDSLAQALDVQCA